MSVSWQHKRNQQKNRHFLTIDKGVVWEKVPSCKKADTQKTCTFPLVRAAHKAEWAASQQQKAASVKQHRAVEFNYTFFFYSYVHLLFIVLGNNAYGNCLIVYSVMSISLVYVDLAYSCSTTLWKHCSAQVRLSEGYWLQQQCLNGSHTLAHARTQTP